VQISNTDQQPAEACLHQLLSNNQESLSDCLSHCGPEDLVVLLAEGVEQIVLVTGSLEQALRKASGEGRALALRADVQARALETVAAQMQMELIDEAAWVELIRSHQHCLSWR